MVDADDIGHSFAHFTCVFTTSLLTSYNHVFYKNLSNASHLSRRFSNSLKTTGSRVGGQLKMYLKSVHGTGNQLIPEYTQNR